MIKSKPDYKRIFKDIIAYKHIDKYDQCKKFLEKKELSLDDVIKLNDIIFGKRPAENQKYKSYDREAIIRILDHQKQNNLTNIAIAKKFNISRNTITRWKKIFLV